MADTYWVSSTGSASWSSCKSVTPLSGLSCCSPSTAFANATGNDLVYFRGGSGGNYNVAGNEYDSPAYQPSHSGNSWSEPLIFRAYTDEVPIFQSTNGHPIMGITGADYVTFDGFSIKHVYSSNDYGPFITYASSGNPIIGLRILNCIFDGGNNTSSTTGDLGNLIFMKYVKGFFFQNCMFRNMRAGSGDTANTTSICMYNTEKSTSPAIDNVIEKCTFYNNNTGFSYKAGNSQYQNDLIFRQNLLYNNVLAGDAGALHIGYTSQGAKIYQNIFIGCGIANADAGNKTNTWIYNNTFINPGGDDGYAFFPTRTDITGWKFYNNIVRGQSNAYIINFEYGASLGSPASGGVDYNIVYDPGYTMTWVYPSGTYTTLASWVSGTGLDTHSQNINPQLVAYANTPTDSNANGYYDGDEIAIYKLATGSPALTAGNTGGPVGAFITGSEQIGYVDITTETPYYINVTW